MQSQEKITQEFRQNGQNGSAGNGRVDKVINRLSTKSGEVINISSRTRASAHTRAEAIHTVVNIPGTVDRKSLNNYYGRYNTGAGACTCTRTRIKNPEAYFRAYRVAKFGGDYNLVVEVVKEAIKAFKPVNVELTCRVWMKIAYRIGHENFLDCVWHQQALFEEWESRGKRI